MVPITRDDAVHLRDDARPLAVVARLLGVVAALRRLAVVDPPLQLGGAVAHRDAVPVNNRPIHRLPPPAQGPILHPLVMSDESVSF